MKYLLLLAATVFFKDLTAQVLIPKPDVRVNIVNELTFEKKFPTAKILYSTDKGIVYALPQDNMPCLVPKEIYSLNEKRQYKQDYSPNSIPNPFQKSVIIPLLQNSKPDIKNYPPLNSK